MKDLCLFFKGLYFFVHSVLLLFFLAVLFTLAFDIDTETAMNITLKTYAGISIIYACLNKTNCRLSNSSNKSFNIYAKNFNSFILLTSFLPLIILSIMQINTKTYFYSDLFYDLQQLTLKVLS